MPANQSLGVRDNCKIETAIREIDVAVGRVVLTPLAGGDTITLGPGDTETFEPPESGFDVYAPEGARFHLTYETDPVDTEEARRQPGTARSSQPRQEPSRRDRSKSSRRTSATKASSKGSAPGKASASGSSPKGGSRASKGASSKSGARKRSSTKSTKKRS